MRQIKFRAWDKKYNQIVEGDEFSISFDGGLMFFNRSSKEYQQLDEDYVIMQFTGLKDKNGKEIYEGDIIVCRDGKYVIEYEESFAKFIMTNKDLIRRPDQFGEQDADTCMRSIEVIGNIYETPELLEEEK